MKKFLVSLALLVGLPVFSGCSTLFGPIVERIAPLIEKYCEEPYGYRSVYRNTVNSQLLVTGHKVHVHCEGDPVDAND